MPGLRVGNREFLAGLSNSEFRFDRVELGEQLPGGDRFPSRTAIPLRTPISRAGTSTLSMTEIRA